MQGIRVVDDTAFSSTPPHLTDASRTLGVWFTEPPGMVVRFLRRATFTQPLAHWLAGPACDGLRDRFAAEESFAFVLDLSHMDGRDPAVRPIILDGVRPWAARAQRAVVVPPETAGRVYLASVRGAASLARLMGLTVAVDAFPDAVRGLRVTTRHARASTWP
jgi:hypothetical protein